MQLRPSGFRIEVLDFVPNPVSLRNGNRPILSAGKSVGCAGLGATAE